MSFELTPAAAERIRMIAGKDGRADLFLRVSVSGGGCQGFQYDMLLDDALTPEDTKIVLDGAAVVVDDVSMAFLSSAKLEWISDLTGECFRIVNPGATSSCGCGTSFSV